MLASSEKIQDLSSRSVGQGPENVVQLKFAIYNHLVIFIAEKIGLSRPNDRKQAGYAQL